MKHLLLILLLLSSISAFPQAVPVDYQMVNGSYQLYRGGAPYFIKGVAFNGRYMDSIPIYGGNSIRTYSTGAETQQILDKAESLGLTVTLGLFARHEADFFNYNDTAAVKDQLEEFRYWVRQYKDHPAVLMWSIGNEADASYTNYRVWDAVNDIAEMIHLEDPLHPTMTVLAGPHDVDITQINARAPAIDVLGVNTYDAIANCHAQLSGNNWNKPYVITEWGPDGTWSTDETSWDAPIELSSTSKAYMYRTRYQHYIAANPIGRCLGSYAFLWGYQQHGEVETWYSTFTVSGESSEAVEALQYVWTGSYPSRRAPRITGMFLNRLNEDDNVTLSGGALNSARVEAYDPNMDSLTYEWLIVEEGYHLKDSPAGASLPGIAGLIRYNYGDSITFRSPEKKGSYRLYVFVHDSNKKVALMNIPFQVENEFDMLENFEGFTSLNLESSVGTYSRVANPAKSMINQTDSTGKYTAPGNDPYDKFIYSSGVAVKDAGKFKSDSFQIRMEIYTSAPAGTPLQLNFQNAEASKGSYPSGRNSVYKAVTTVQNEWSTVTFSYYNAPDPSVSDVMVDQLVFAFDAGASSSYVYYLDNIRIEKEYDEALSPGEIYENYETIHHMQYLSSSGGYQVVANPWQDSHNSTDSTSMYSRHESATYDGLTFSMDRISDASLFVSNKKAFAIELYTEAPVGTLMEIQLRNDTMSGSYPSGRHSVYQARVLKQHAWHRVIFRYISSPDSNVPDDLIDRMVFLLSPAKPSGDTYYIDNIRSITINEEVPDLPDPWKSLDIGDVGLAGNTVDKYSGKVFVLQASGENIWGTADEFHYAFQPFGGDGEITCFIPSISPDIDPYVKAGLMMRETLDDDARHAMVYITPDNGNAFQYRNATAGSCSKASNAYSIDRWLRLKRQGDTFISYQSNDGDTWAMIDSATIGMRDSIYVGLALTADNDAAKAKATFRDISIAYPTGGQSLRLVSEQRPEIKDSMKPYPNPVADLLYIPLKDSTSKVPFEVYDLNGKRLKIKSYFNDEELIIDYSRLESGLYILKLQSASRLETQMIIKRY